MDEYTEPQLDASALITIDVQRDTLDGAPLEIPGTSAALPAMARLVEAFRAGGQPIVHVVRLYREDGSNVDLCRRASVMDGARILTPGSDGAELAPALLPPAGAALETEELLAGELQPLGPNEWALYKPRWGAFYDTRLEEHLRGLGVTTTVFCGCNFPNCPRTSMYEASERDFRVALATDAISGLYDRGRAELEGIGVALMRADELAAAVGSPAASRA
jgi:nicotinamidase-related amidase